MKTLIKVLFVTLIAFLPIITSAQLTENNDGSITVTTNNGQVRIGTLNASGNTHIHAVDNHITKFHFNRRLWVSTGEIGSYNANLSLKTHNDTRMTILRDNGFVGIGTATPEAQLDVNGAIRSSYNSDNYLELSGGLGSSTINHAGPGFGQIKFSIADVSTMVLNSGGRVGIGTDDPTEALDVNGNIILPTADYFKGNIYLGGKTNLQEIGMRLFGGDIANGQLPGGFIDVVTNDPSQGLRFRIDQNNGSAEKMRIRADGKVVIGNPANITTPGDYKLYVDGGVLTKRVRVAEVNSDDWADYVFAEDYDLNSTEEVETFIKENKHLPNVPSAKEVSEKGVDVVEMDATLLRQIEELWLHVIELKKENKALKEKVETLESTKR